LLDFLRRWPRVIDAVVTEGHACLYFDPAFPPDDPSEAAARLAVEGPAGERKPATIRARYDGADLADLARLTGLSRDEVVELHTSREYVVALIGFLPGFAYLRGLDPRLEVPRRAIPRARVAPGSIGLAAGYTGVYPFASPGGWQLIGTAIGFEAFSVERGASLAIGDRVRFERVD